MTYETIADRIRELHHLAWPVADVERAEQFYTRALGAKVTRRRTDPELARTDPRRATHISIQLGQAPRIDIFPQEFSADARELPHPHGAFDVPTEEFLECARLLTAQGIGHSGPVRQGPPGTASIYGETPGRMRGDAVPEPTGDHQGPACFTRPPPMRWRDRCSPARPPTSSCSTA
jgi:catechol 2,3-dioxygenase-like lactoylglutathione lyase family enzyme